MHQTGDGLLDDIAAVWITFLACFLLPDMNNGAAYLSEKGQNWKKKVVKLRK